MSAGCLSGFRILDLSQYLPGPYATQLLADLGAEVVKVEPPGGDPFRQVGTGDGLAAWHALVNAGKTVVRLDLKDESGKATFADLVARADVLLESYRPGTLERLGFGRISLEAINPKLVHCALSGYGQTGPYAQRAGHDINYMAWSGGLAGSGTPERPIPAFPPVADFAGAMQAALAITAALLRRERSGGGAYLDVSLAETALAWQAGPLTAAALGGEAARGAGLLSGGAACYQVYETADGAFASLGALEAKFWVAFCTAVERKDWIARQRDPLPQTQLIEEVALLIRGRSLAEWQKRLEGVDCCWQPVLPATGVLADPQVRARGLVRSQAGTVEVLFPTLFDAAAPTPRTPMNEQDAADLAARWRREDQA